MSQIPQDFIDQLTASERGSASKRPVSFTKEYQAVVVDVEDPLKQGRVKVWIPDTMIGKGGPDQKKIGLWAMPSNNTFAGNKEAKDKGMDDCGSCIVPPKGSYVTVYFEDGDYSYPRYKAAVNKEVDQAVPVENQYGSQPWKTYTLLKTPEGGRQILLSDDPDNEGIIIRGKYKSRGKRENMGDPRAPKDSYYIQIWEKAGEEFMLMKDADGKYLKMDKIMSL